MKRVGLLVLFFVLAGGAQAFLPPDSAVREPQIRARRIQLKEEYNERILERRKQATRAYERATAAIEIPPWKLDRVLNGKPEHKSSPDVQRQRIGETKSKSRIWVPIGLLILTGFGVGWVQYKTREIE